MAYYKRIGIWNKPKGRRAYTLFGSGQHHGETDCEFCHQHIKRNSGMQKCCGPYNDKNSCAYRYELRKKKIWYFMSKYTPKSTVVHIKNSSDTPSKILICACGKRYIKTRLNQENCLQCIYESTK